jgi:4-hydroxybenzoate polyprenyltransferase
MDFRLFSKLILIEQTFFAMPFALIGVLFAGGGTPMTWVLAIIALGAARTAGMSFNRVIDAEIDAKNPRTSDRPVPKGEVKTSIVWWTAIVSSLVLIGASFMLNSLCFYLSFPAVFLLFTYSYFKRFSSSSHFYLGFVEAAAPIGGYLAVTGEFALVPFVLGFAIMTWIAGLDIVYALQDMDFDTSQGLHSMPVRLGKEKALLLSSISYFLSFCSMIYAGTLVHMGFVYWVSLILIAVIFTCQQILARRKDVVSSIKTFFKINMFISPILFFGSLIDVLLD